eukprot:CAMPEP_0206163986 /NCGR_PEP_ID=MMETSP1474-20131121/13553_1 /ASSEMBLY_ACC=CAM_ASM_001110 /TAXON_ID=97495 /ORGANISM="Imantonia sp., Strain RCC918" /LENGTH=32 /DNA_ID= /DNA_START= /DNA_END= /DNA_ORIENTATION=
MTSQSAYWSGSASSTHPFTLLVSFFRSCPASS